MVEPGGRALLRKRPGGVGWMLGLLLLASGGAQISAAETVVPQETAELLQGLAGPEVALQEKAVAALADRGDPPALFILKALEEGGLNLWTTPSGEHRVVILRTDEGPSGSRNVLVDPLSATVLREWSDSDEGLAPVSLHSSEARRLLHLALERLKLFDPSPGVRSAAATRMGNEGEASAIPQLARALSLERDRWTRHAMEGAIAQIHLIDPDPAVRKEAAITLGRIRSVEALPQLRALLVGATAETDAGVREAVGASVRKIETYQSFEQLLETLFSGLSLGSILLMMGLGLAIIFGLMGVINMAHGEMMMVGAYATFTLQELFASHLPSAYQDLYFLAAIPFSFLITALGGLLLEKSIIRFLYGRPLETLLATWGVSLVLQQAARWYFGDLTSVNAPGFLRGGVQVMAGLVLPYNRIFIIVLSALGLWAVHLLLSRSRWGLKMRAVTQNRDMSACLGISTRRVDGWTFALGAGLAGLAGCALTLIGNVDPEMGKTYIVDSFMVVVVGGVGKLAGTVVSALGIGMLNKILEPMIGGTGGAIYAKLFLLAGIILFLQRKPSGLFPGKGRAVESP